MSASKKRRSTKQSRNDRPSQTTGPWADLVWSKFEFMSHWREQTEFPDPERLMAQDDAGRMFLQIRPIEDGLFARDGAVSDQMRQLIQQWGQPCLTFPRTFDDTVFIMYYYPSKRGQEDEELLPATAKLHGMEMVTCTPGTTVLPVKVWPDAFYDKNDDFRRRTGMLIGKVQLLK